MSLIYITLPEFNMEPENKIGDSFWKPPFFGFMLIFGGVCPHQQISIVREKNTCIMRNIS